MLRSVEQFGAPRVLVELVVAKIDAGRVDHHFHRAGTGGPVQRNLAAAAVELATPHRQPCQVVGLEAGRSEEHTSELQSLMRNSYAVFCLKKKTTQNTSPKTRSKPLTNIHISNT